MQVTKRRFFRTAGLGTAALMTAAVAPIPSPETSQPVAPGGAQAGSPDAGPRPMKVVSLADVEARAHARMSEAAWAFVAEGSGDGWTVAENRRAFNDYPIVPRRLRYGGRGNFLEQKTALTLDDIGAIRTLTGLPVVVKGILRGVDARDAVSAGAAAVQVSNHGGRQIDGVPASVSALPEVVDAVGGQVPVLLDGGIRRGIDVFRALALGATAVATARPILFGAALAGSAGVAAVLEHLRDELHQTMLLAGTQRIADINRDCLRGTGGDDARTLPHAA